MKIYLLRRHAQMVADGACIDYVTILKDILNLKKHQNRMTGFKVRAIWLNG